MRDVVLSIKTCDWARQEWALWFVAPAAEVKRSSVNHQHLAQNDKVVS